MYRLTHSGGEVYDLRRFVEVVVSTGKWFWDDFLGLSCFSLLARNERLLLREASAGDRQEQTTGPE
jgi:hypothetical protein